MAFRMNENLTESEQKIDWAAEVEKEERLQKGEELSKKYDCQSVWDIPPNNAPPWVVNQNKEEKPKREVKPPPQKDSSDAWPAPQPAKRPEEKAKTGEGSRKEETRQKTAEERKKAFDKEHKKTKEITDSETEDSKKKLYDSPEYRRMKLLGASPILEGAKPKTNLRKKKFIKKTHFCDLVLILGAPSSGKETLMTKLLTQSDEEVDRDVHAIFYATEKAIVTLGLTDVGIQERQEDICIKRKKGDTIISKYSHNIISNVRYWDKVCSIITECQQSMELPKLELFLFSVPEDSYFDQDEMQGFREFLAYIQRPQLKKIRIHMPVLPYQMFLFIGVSIAEIIATNHIPLCDYCAVKKRFGAIPEIKRAVSFKHSALCGEVSLCAEHLDTESYTMKDVFIPGKLERNVRAITNNFESVRGVYHRHFFHMPDLGNTQYILALTKAKTQVEGGAQTRREGPFESWDILNLVMKKERVRMDHLIEEDVETPEPTKEASDEGENSA